MEAGGGSVRARAGQADRARSALEALGWRDSHLIMARSFGERLMGMLAVPPAALDGAPCVLAFPRCSSVHTCFMRSALDIAFIGPDGELLARYAAVPPWRLLSHPGAVLVLERVSDAGAGACGRARVRP